MAEPEDPTMVHLAKVKVAFWPTMLSLYFSSIPSPKWLITALVQDSGNHHHMHICLHGKWEMVKLWRSSEEIHGILKHAQISSFLMSNLSSVYVPRSLCYLIALGKA